MMKKKDLIEKILNFTQDGGVADTETQQSPAEAPKKTRRPRIAKTESTQSLRRNTGATRRTDHDDTDSRSAKRGR